MQIRYAPLALFWALALNQNVDAQTHPSCHNIFQAEWCEDSALLALHNATMHSGHDSVQFAALKGRLHFELLDFEQAMANLKFALDAGSHDLDLLLYIAYSYLLTGMAQQAEHAFVLCLVENPTCQSAIHGRLQALIMLGRQDDACRIVSNWAQSEPYHMPYQNFWEARCNAIEIKVPGTAFED